MTRSERLTVYGLVVAVVLLVVAFIVIVRS